MSFIDWSLAPQPQSPLQQQQAISAQTDNLQRQRGLSALHGIDWNDPNSVKGGINALQGLGLTDLAKAQVDLAQTRFVNSKVNPVLGAALDQASSDVQQPNSDQQSDLDAQHRQILQQGADAVNDLLNTADPTQRATKAAAYKQKFAQMGLQQANIDEVLGDLSDAGLKQHEAFLTAVANGQEADHPTGYAASQNVFNANNPGGSQAAQTLQGHLANPIVQAALAKAGIDVSPGINQAISITGAARAAAGSAPYTPVTVEGPQGQNVAMSAANFAAGQARPDAQAIQGATPYAKSAQTAAAGAPYTPVTTTGPGGQSQTQSAAQFAAGRGAPEAPGGAPGPMNAAPITGPTTAGAAVNKAGGDQYASDLVTAGQSQQQVNALQSILRLLPTTPIGPGTETVNQWRSFLHTQLPILDKIIPGTDQRAVDTADTNQLLKYMAQLATTSSAQYGAPSDNRLAAAVSGNPHATMDTLGATQVTQTMLALKRADMAAPYLFSTLKGPDGQPIDQGQYGAFKSNYARTVDPRAFELDMLTPSERQNMMATITSPDDKKKFLLGVQAAEAAGYYHRQDLPR